MTTPRSLLLLPLACLALTACPGVSNEGDAARAWLGMEHGVDRVLQLGMDGFNAASSANIPTQTGAGEVDGLMTVDGQVDQGASDNKGLRLQVMLDAYADGPVDVDVDGRPDGWALVYDTAEGDFLDVDLQLRGLPDAALTGTLIGDAVVGGDLEGPVQFDLQLDGTTEPLDGGEDDQIQIVAGSLSVSGTVTSDFGVYQVDLPATE